jgi:hypothetical protein
VEQNYNLEPDFDKGMVIKVVEKVRELLGRRSIVSGVIHVHQRRFRLNLETNQSLTEPIYEVYQLPEVCEVGIGADAAGRMPYMDVVLAPNWFEETGNEKPFRSHRHPEEEGGSFA